MKSNHENNLNNQPLLDLSALTDKSDHTLMFGRTKSRKHVHIYVKNSIIHAITYKPVWHANATTADNVIDIIIDDNTPCITLMQIIGQEDAKFYTALCDKDFCKVLTNNHITAHFFDEHQYESRVHSPKHNTFDDSQYYGYTL